jgi:hypothetical protein
LKRQQAAVASAPVAQKAAPVSVNGGDEIIKWIECVS